VSITPQNVQVRRKWWQTVVTDDDDAAMVEMFVCVWTGTVWLYVSVVSSLLSTFRLIQTTENVSFTHWFLDILFFWHIILDILVFHHRPQSWLVGWLLWLADHTTSASSVYTESAGLLSWHAPLEVRSAKRRHQSPEWTILGHNVCFVQGEVLDFRSCWIVFIHVVWGHPGGLLQFSSASFRTSDSIFL